MIELAASFRWRADSRADRARREIVRLEATLEDEDSSPAAIERARVALPIAREHLKAGNGFKLTMYFGRTDRTNELAWRSRESLERLLEIQQRSPCLVAYVEEAPIFMFQGGFFLGDGEAIDEDVPWAAGPDKRSVLHTSDGRNFASRVATQGDVEVDQISLVPRGESELVVVECRNTARVKRRVEATVLVRDSTGTVLSTGHDSEWRVPPEGHAIISATVTVPSGATSIDLLVEARPT